MQILLSHLRALYGMYQYMHWRVEGEQYYGDHMLYERLYGGIVGEIDLVAEKMIGISGDTDAIKPHEDMDATNAILKKLIDDSDRADDFPEKAINAEKLCLEIIKGLMEQGHSDGVEDMLQGIASKHEEHLYLLQQRAKTKEASMGTMAKLYKLAYILDKNGLYDETTKVEEIMSSMASKSDFSDSDIVALADYFDFVGDASLANKFDKMLITNAKEESKKRPPKKWWDKMEKEIKKNSPDYSDEQVAKTIGDIWFNNLKEKKRKQITKRDRKSEK